VRQEAPLERALADPDHVPDEVVEPELAEPLGDPGVDLGPLAGEDEQFLGAVALDRPVEQALYLIRRV
jgi:hypothetical protein